MSSAKANAHPSAKGLLSKMGRIAVVLRVLAVVIQFCSYFVTQKGNITPGSEVAALTLLICGSIAGSFTIFALLVSILLGKNRFFWKPAVMLSPCSCITSAIRCVLSVVILSCFVAPPMTWMQVRLGLHLSVLFLCCLSAGLDHREMAKLMALLEDRPSPAPSPTSAGNQDVNNDSSVV